MALTVKFDILSHEKDVLKVRPVVRKETMSLVDIVHGIERIDLWLSDKPDNMSDLDMSIVHNGGIDPIVVREIVDHILKSKNTIMNILTARI